MGVSLAKGDFVVLYHMLRRMSPHSAREVNELTAQATSYVWGFQDATGGPQDTNEPWRFGMAYGRHAAEMTLEVCCWRQSIPSAFRSWRANGNVSGEVV